MNENDYPELISEASLLSSHMKPIIEDLVVLDEYKKKVIEEKMNDTPKEEEKLPGWVYLKYTNNGLTRSIEYSNNTGIINKTSNRKDSYNNYHNHATRCVNYMIQKWNHYKNTYISIYDQEMYDHMYTMEHYKSLNQDLEDDHEQEKEYQQYLAYYDYEYAFDEYDYDYDY